MLQRKPPAGVVRTLARWRKRPPSEDRLAIASGAARILIIKLHDQLGDFVLVTPAIQALRERFPNARLALLTRAYMAPLAGRVKGVDVVWDLPRIRSVASLARFMGTALQVMRFRPDVVFVMNTVSRSKSADAYAWLSGARLIVGRSLVFAGEVPSDAPEDPGARALEGPPSDLLYDLDIDVGRGSRAQIERLMDLVRWVAPDARTPRVHLELSTADRESGRKHLDEALQGAPATPDSKVVGLHPGATNPLKVWPLESFVELGAQLASPDHGEPRLVVFDSPRERGRAAALVAGLAARGVIAGLVPARGIEDYTAICTGLDLLVCNDSGAMHIAAAVGVPTVSFHSLGDPREWAPQHDRAVAFHAPRDITTIPVSAAVEAVRALRSLSPER